jgi:hypothetical protein
MFCEKESAHDDRKHPSLGYLMFVDKVKKVLSKEM